MVNFGVPEVASSYVLSIDRQNPVELYVPLFQFNRGGDGAMSKAKAGGTVLRLRVKKRWVGRLVERIAAERVGSFEVLPID